MADLPNLEIYRKELLPEGLDGENGLTTPPADGWLNYLPAPPGGKLGWPWTTQSKPDSTEPDNKSTPLITIVVPSYNQGQFMEEALRSILLQNHPKLQLIVMDGGSTDGTHSVLQKYLPWISFLREKPDRGQAHAINQGFSIAASQGIRGWLNSDDFYLPGAFACLALNHTHDTGTFYYGDGFSYNETTAIWGHDKAGLVTSFSRRYPGLIFSHAAFWDTSIHEAVREELHCSMDYELWIRLIPKSRKLRHVPRPLGTIRIHPDAKSHDPAQIRRWNEDAELNGKTHPELYRSGRLHAGIHRILQRLNRSFRQEQSQFSAGQVWDSCQWGIPNPFLK